MTTRGDQIDVRVRERGAAETTNRLNRVRGAVRGVGRATTGALLPLIGGSLLAGVFGFSLLSLATSGGAASNAMVRLQATLERLIGPFIPLLVKVVEFLSLLPTWALGVLVVAFLMRGVLIAAIGAAAGALAGFLGISTGGLVLAIIAIGIAFYLLYTRFKPVRDGVHAGLDLLIDDTNRWITRLLQGINILDRVSKAGAAFEENPFDFGAIRRAYRSGGTLIPPHIIAGARIPQVPRPDESNFEREGLFSLLPFERRVLGLATPSTRTIGPAPAPGPQITYNNYGLSVEEINRRLRDALNDPQLRRRHQGGP